ncbi:MAG: hypothetical protein Q4G63_10205 [Bacteroidia bacterium]|nr:hypothetical protein [Bacteroidia bacterium]
MKQQNSKFLLNRVAIFQYAFSGALAFFIIALFLFNPQNQWIMWIILLPVIFGVLREINGYRLSDQDTIESYCLLWRAKNKSVNIHSILALQELSEKKLMIEYQKEGGESPLYTSYLLKSEDIQYLKNELLKRNPNIEVVQS